MNHYDIESAESNAAVGGEEAARKAVHKRPRRRWLLLLLLGLLLLIPGGGGGFYWAYSSMERVQTHPALLVIRRADDVKVQPRRSGMWQPASGTVSLDAGDGVSLGKRSMAAVYYFDGSAALLKGPAEFRLLKSQEVSKGFGGDRHTIIEVEVSLGSVVCEASPASRFRLRSPTAALYTEGSTFRCQVEADGTSTWTLFESAAILAALGVGETGEVEAGLVNLHGGSSLHAPALPHDLLDSQGGQTYAGLYGTALSLLETTVQQGQFDAEPDGASLKQWNQETGSAVYTLDGASDLPRKTQVRPVAIPAFIAETSGADDGLQGIGITVAESQVLGIPSVPDPPAAVDPTQLRRPRPPRYLFSIYGVTSPIGIAVEPQGRRIYVTESGGARAVHVFDSEGNHLKALIPPDSTEATSRSPLYAGFEKTTGTLFVSDRSRQAVDMYNWAGSYIGQLTLKDSDAALAAPIALAFGYWDDLFLTDLAKETHRVLVVDADRHVLSVFGKEGAGLGEFSFPNGIAVDSVGNVYVADSNNFRIQSFQAGDYQFRAGVSPIAIGMPRGLAMDQWDRLHAVDTFGHSVVVFQAGATFSMLLTFGEHGIDAGEFSYPNGIAVDETGRIYVTDRANDRVQVWEYPN